MTVIPCEKLVEGLPLLKWPGGKRGLLRHIWPLVPRYFDRYFEPFAGGAALFFALKPANAVVSDNNTELINCYTQVRDRPLDVIKYLGKLRNTAHDYYEVRSVKPTTDIMRAARFIYLTSLSFNGIYRQNLKGEFNVPYGYKTHINPSDPNKIIAASQALSGVELHCGDFAESLQDAKSDDLVYIDPPYTVAHSNNGFVKYNAKVFSWADQVRLAELAKQLAKRECRVIVSNADHSSIRELYNGFEVLTVERASVIAASSSYRQQITECIFYNA